MIFFILRIECFKSERNNEPPESEKVFMVLLISHEYMFRRDTRPLRCKDKEQL